MASRLPQQMDTANATHGGTVKLTTWNYSVHLRTVLCFGRPLMYSLCTRCVQFPCAQSPSVRPSCTQSPLYTIPDAQSSRVPSFYCAAHCVCHLSVNSPAVYVPPGGVFNSIQFNSIQFNSVQFNSIQFNLIQFNSIQFNSIQFNSIHSIQFNSIQFNSIQFNSIQFNSIQFNSIQFSSVQFNSIQFNSIQFNSIQFNSIQFNSIQFNSIQFNSIQFNSIQFNSIQFSSIQFNSIQFNSIQFNSIQFNAIQCNSIQFDSIQLVNERSILLAQLVDTNYRYVERFAPTPSWFLSRHNPNARPT